MLHPHAGGSGSPGSLKNLNKVADSLPEFLRSLAARDYLHFRAWYKLPVKADELNLVAAKLIKSGFIDPLQHFNTIAERKSGIAYHAKTQCAVWLAHAGEAIEEIAAPKSVPANHSILAIDAYRWDHPAAEQFVKRVLKSVKIEKLTKLGETPLPRRVTM